VLLWLKKIDRLPKSPEKTFRWKPFQGFFFMLFSVELSSGRKWGKIRLSREAAFWAFYSEGIHSLVRLRLTVLGVLSDNIRMLGNINPFLAGVLFYILLLHALIARGFDISD
jgi:hypothetical protein